MYLENKKSLNPLIRFRQNRKVVKGPNSVLNSIIKKNNKSQFDLVDRFVPGNSKNAYWIPEGNLWELKDKDLNMLKFLQVILGPNINWFDGRNVEILNSLDNAKILAPSHWVKVVLQSELGGNKQILTWAAGVDVDYWLPHKSMGQSILIYLKNLKHRDLAEELRVGLNNMGYRVNILEYGGYSHRKFKALLNESCVAIWLGGSESQGIAMLETWSMNVPTLVLSQEHWTSPNGKIYRASAAPYLTEECGEFADLTLLSAENVVDFYNRTINGEFSPRKYAVSNFSLSIKKKDILDKVLASRPT